MHDIIFSTLLSALEPILENATGAFLGSRFHELNEIRKDQKKPAQAAINSAFEEWIIAINKSWEVRDAAVSSLVRY